MSGQFRAVGWVYIIVAILGLLYGFVQIASMKAMSQAMVTMEKYPGMSQPGHPSQPQGTQSKLPGYPNVPTNPGYRSSTPYATPSSAPSSALPTEFMEVVKGATIGILIISIICNGFLVFAGWAVLSRRPWGRTVAIVAGCLALLSCMPGIIATIVGLVIMLKSGADAEWRTYTAQA